ncbi:hypothetical protein BsWGS_07041 [Bradybaena similaris]
MFLSVFLIALPAAALAICDPDALLQIFDVIDVNKDNRVDLLEAADFYKILDVNEDSLVTLAEAEATIPSIAPNLTAKEEILFNTYDLNRNGVVEESEVVGIFQQTDSNGDGLRSRDEFELLLKLKCNKPQRHLFKSYLYK